jgi:hypothetical protein
MFSTVQKGWDVNVLRELVQHADVSTLLTYPFCNETSQDLHSYFTKRDPVAQFFTITQTLELDVQPMCRPGVTPSIGISIRHGLAGSVSSMLALMETACQNSFQDDLPLSFLASSVGLRVFHGSQLIACRAKRRVPNRRSNLEGLRAAFQLYPSAVLEWLHETALDEGDDDILLYGRAMLGMSANHGKQEILVKYGSEEAFETEKEALKYG